MEILPSLPLPQPLPLLSVTERPTIWIGWVEFATLSFAESLPQPKSLKVKAKVDTGANTSSLHAVDIVPFTKEDKLFLKFIVPLHGIRHEVQAPVARRGFVRSSEGAKDERYFIEAEIRIGKTSHPIVLSLNDRSSMLYPVLLGRSFLRDRYIVDVSRKFLLNKKSCARP